VHPDVTKNKTLTKRASDDGESSLRKILCMEVLTTFKKSTDNFGIGSKGEHYVYDGGKTFYLAAPMVLDAGKNSTDNFGTGSKGEHYVYDGGKSLYLAAPMVLDAGKKRKEFATEEFSTFCKNQLVDCSV
uniref:Uncharacterized protein n=1 Tax=Panagrolaimus sp. ES5 TaxID=591445 RepID=A0AC34GE14_9BILA